MTIIDSYEEFSRLYMDCVKRNTQFCREISTIMELREKIIELQTQHELLKIEVDILKNKGEK